MAGVPDIDKLYKDIFRKDKTVVGWGTGSLFHSYNNMLPIAIDYLVDNNPDKWGNTIEGIPVHKPEKLLKEDPENLIIVIYSSFIDQITEQIRSMDEALTCVPVSTVFGCKEYQFHWWKMSQKVVGKSLGKNKKSDRAIVIQGPLTSERNIEVIKYYAYAFPNDPIIVSTWEASDPVLIRKVECIADHCVLSTPPSLGGFQNRNFQIVSTLNGLEKAKELGVKKVLKTRTDLAALADNLLESCAQMQELYDPEICWAYGLQNRIVIPEIYTRRYILYNIADILMFGDLPDLIKFWSLPLDNRIINVTDPSWVGKTLYQLSLDCGPAESYLGRQFAKTIGWEMQDTVQDSWRFYRDLFVVNDCRWFEMFWMKYPKLPSVETSNIAHNCVSHAFWQQLYFDLADMDRLAGAVDIHKTLWDGFYQDFVPYDNKLSTTA